MFGEQQAIIPNFTYYPTPNPNPNHLSPHGVVISDPIVGSRRSELDSSSNPHLRGLQPESAFELDRALASRSRITSTTFEYAHGTLSEATKASAVLHSASNFGVATQHVVNNAMVTTMQPGNIQPMQCEVCNVTCNSGDALEKHKQGKKHLKNLQKLAITSFIAPKMPPPVASAPLVGELENKKHKLLQNGASADTLIYCGICNVVCNNQDTFRTHLAGRKHSAKLANTNGISNHTSECIPEAQPSNGGLQKKPDTLQPARCEVCNISCTSNEALRIHLSGKKHLRKAAAAALALKEEGKVGIVDGSKRKAKRAGSEESLETKKQKVLNGGAASDALRTCTVCNVVCNSPTVFISHLAGQKHAAMAVKHAEARSTGQET